MNRSSAPDRDRDQRHGVSLETIDAIVPNLSVLLTVKMRDPQGMNDGEENPIEIEMTESLLTG
jgi:hypothetical protein